MSIIKPFINQIEGEQLDTSDLNDLLQVQTQIQIFGFSLKIIN